MSDASIDTSLAERIQSARRMAGLSLQELADRMDNPVSKQAINQFEQGKIKPETDTLFNIAKALNVRLDFFYRKTTVSLGKIEYRKQVKLTKTEDIIIQETAKDKLERYFELEEITNSFSEFQNPLKVDFIINNLDDIEKAAEEVRIAWSLGVNPISNVVEMLEEKGIKVIEVNASSSFQGFHAEVNNRHLIVLNSNDDAFRKRFTASHELGHILLKFADGVSNGEIEKYCHSFSGAFLFPRESVLKVFSEKRKKLSFAELIQQKCYYGISIQAILMRLKNLEIINEATHKGLIIWMNKSGYRTKEPGNYAGVEKAIRFSQLLYRAAIEEVISLSKAAALNNQTLNEFRKTLGGYNTDKL